MKSLTKYNSTILIPLLFLLSNSLSGKEKVSSTHSIWFDNPAIIWEECLPQGNGRLGIMADGGIERENIVLNEISLWSGCEYDYSNPEAAATLPRIRELLNEGKNSEAQTLMYEQFVPKKSQNGGTYGSYQILGNLGIEYFYDSITDSIIDYTRVLDLQTGLSETNFTLQNGVTYNRRYAVPREADGIILEFTASRPSSINLQFTLTRPERGSLKVLSDSLLLLYGNLDSGVPEKKGMEYITMAGTKIKGDRGKIQLIGDSAISVNNADTLWICISSATSYRNDNDFKEKTLSILEGILENPSIAVQKGIESHVSLMNRASLILDTNENSFLPTPIRLEKFIEDDTDASLAALYYNYGRYLLISSCRPDLLPPNLQGLWTKDIQTPWNGDYHTNINVQMNHWIAEPGNLSEFHLPLACLVKEAVQSGERTAKSFYGDEARGWVMHMMTNIWNYTEPGEHPSWGATNTGGAWLCNHIWQHYLFTGQKDFLKEYYPVLKGASEFFLSTMVKEPANGWLVSSPSSSPENDFYSPEPGAPIVSVCMGPAMDTQIIRELWKNTLRAAEILGLEDKSLNEIRESLPLLPPIMKSSDGRIMEWLEEYKEVDPRHRHVSHLYALYPGNEISISKTPELAKGAFETLRVRGDGGTGWSRAWKINFFARLQEGEHAWKILKGLLSPAISDSSKYHYAGSYPNLFCAHPPFQIDGNFGGAAGISEMLVQSHEGFIRLLPALNSNLSKGNLKGFKTIGGIEIDMIWDNFKPVEIKLKKGFEDEVSLLIPENVNKIFFNGGKNELEIPSDRKITLRFDNPQITLYLE